MKTGTIIRDRPSQIQDEISGCIFRAKALTGEVPSVREISEAVDTSACNVRYHLNKMAERRWLERHVVEQVLYKGSRLAKQEAKAPRYADNDVYGCGKNKRQGSSPDRARQITDLLLTDEHAVDRWARLFSGAWRKGVDL